MTPPLQHDHRLPKPKPALHVLAFVLGYLAIGVVYILVSDYLTTRWVSSGAESQFIQSYKGVGFISITALLLYLVLSLYKRRLDRLVSESQQTNYALITALDRYPGPAAIFNEHRLLTYANSYTSVLFKQPVDECIGKPAAELFSSEYVSANLHELLSAAYSTAEPKGGEIEIHRTDGDSRYYVLNFVPTVSADGGVQRVFVLAYDISDRKHSAIRIDMQRRELRQIIDLIPNFVFAKNAHGRYIMANEAFSRFHGLSPAEVLGKTIEAILPDEKVTADVLSQDTEVLEKDTPVYRPCQAVTAHDGQVRMFQVTKIPFRSAADNSTAVLGVAIDITDQLQHEQAISKSRERFSALVEHSLDALFVYDQTGVITLVNERASEVVEMPSEQLVGKNLIDILVGESSWASSRARPPLFDPGTSFQMVIGGGSSRSKPVEIRVGTLPGEDEGAYLAEIRDISERLRSEREGILLSRLGVDLSAARDAAEIGKAVFAAVRAYMPMDAFFFAIRVSGKSRFRHKVTADTVDGELKFFPEFDYETTGDAGQADYYKGISRLILRNPGQDESNNFVPFGNVKRTSKSLLFVPIKVNEQVLALMSVQSYQYDAYSDEHLELLERMANMTAPPLESAQASRRAEIFARLGQQLGAARTAEQVAEHVAAMGDELVGWDCCIVALYSAEEDTITYIYLSDLVDGKRKRLLEPYPFKKPQLYAERVLKEGPFLVLREKPPLMGEFVPMGKSNRASLSMIWVPIPGEDGPIGFIALQSYTLDAYDENDLTSICALADHCGAAINRTASQELLRYREERYRRAIESIGAVAYQMDLNTRTYIFMGQQIEAITGYPASEFTGEFWKKIMLEIQVDPASEYTVDENGNNWYKYWRAVMKIRRKDGTEAWISDQAVQLQNAAGKPIGTLGILLDITSQKRYEIALRTSEERYALSARGANDGLWDWNLATNKIHFSERWGQMLGMSPDQILEDPEKWFELIHPDDVDSMKRLLDDHLSGRARHFECEVRTLHQNGVYCWMLIRGIAVRDNDNRATRIAGSQTDITDRVNTQERLMHDALHDPLTGLPNRALLMDHLARCLENMKRRPGFTFALVFMDLDRFKTINDSLGHLTGDHVLITTAQRLKRSIRPMDVVARFAGDEFALVLENVESEEEVFEIVSRAQTVMAEPINVENHEIISTSSAGIAMGSTDYENASDLLRDADNALYKAKADGAGRCRMFDSSMHEQAVKTLHLEADLRRVIERHQLRLYFQPLIDLKTGQIERFEALLRWKHPDRGIIMPDQFMPIAEETGLIFALDEWVVGEACRWWKRWHAMLNGSGDQMQDLRMNLNLSPRHFGRHINLAERLVDIIHGEGLQPDLFGLELTENAILTFRNETTTALHALKDAGFSLYLDDFGKGYSSLSYLHSFPFDMVKIDRQFIIRMQNEGPEREIVQAILALAGKLNLGVVAEGIETAEQMEIVRDLGCDLAQGFFISKPVTPNEAMDIMASDCRW